MLASVAGQALELRLLHENDSSHEGASSLQHHLTLNVDFVQGAAITVMDFSSQVYKVFSEKEDERRTAKVALQNHDVCPLGFPMCFRTTVRLLQPR